jgi:polysaccharide biosynthesis transport protein
VAKNKDMKKVRLKNLNDWLALIVRQRWWVIATIVAFCGLTMLLALVMPKSYTSRTMILLQPRDIPSDFVKDLIGGNIDERLSSIEQTILSRTNLLKILDEYESQMPEYGNLNDERKVLKLRKRITIDFPSEQRRGVFLPTTNIMITYRNRSPELAQKITARLASLFIEQDNQTREEKVFGTAEFLEAEVKKVSDQLRQSEDALRILKQRYRYEMPSEQETNLRTLDRLQVQKTGNLEALDRYVTLQMNLERQISETPPVVYVETAGKTPIGTPLNPEVENYRKKEQEYKELLIKAKPDHPDARRLKAELDQLRAELPPDALAVTEKKPAPAPAASQPNPVYQSLTAQLRQLKTDIAIREREKQEIESEMDKYNQRIQNTPGVEQEMLAVTRTNEQLTKQHEELKKKLDDAKLAGSLESKQKGAQFAIIDPANYPLEPAPPGRLVILVIGFVLSLAAGIAVALAVSTLSQRVWTYHELERALEVPVLVEIPSMDTTTDTHLEFRRRLAHALLFLLCAGAYLGGIYYLYHRQSAVLHLLDPLIETIEERAAKQS